MRPLFAAAAALLALCFSPFVTDAQVTNITDQTSTPAPGTGHNYIQLLNETVNPANGSLSLRIEVPMPPGRKLTLPFSLAYDSNGLRVIQPGAALGSTHTTFSQGAFAWGAWSYAIPQLSRVGVQYALKQKAGDGSQDCNATTGYTFADPSGSRHAFYLSHIYNLNLPGFPPTETSACITSNYREYDTDATQDQRFQAALVGVTYGTSNATMVPSTDGDPQIVDSDGTVYYFGNGWGCSPNNPTNFGLPTSIEDRNGNFISVFANYGFTETCHTSGTPSIAAADSAGRTVFSATGNGFGNGTTDTVTVAGLSTPYTVTWGAMGTGSIALSQQQVVTDSNCSFGGDSDTLYGGPITQVSLPNSETYQLTYTAGEYLQQIKYPTGGTVTYTWGANPLSAFVQYDDTLGRHNGCQYRYDTPAVKKRVVSFDGTNNALEQDFSYFTQWDSMFPNTWDWKTTTVTTSDLIRGTSFQTVYKYLPYPVIGQPNMATGNTGGVPFENTITYFDTNGTLLKTVTKGWGGPFELGCEIAQLGTSGLIGGSFYSYGPGAVMTDEKVYDYGRLTSTSCTPPGTIADRETAITYQNFAPTPIYTPSPAAPTIFDRPCKAVIKGSTGAVVAETDYLYDGGSTTCGTAGTASVASANGPTQHDARYAYNAAAQPRGNSTKTTKQCFPSCTNQVTSYSYDETGQVVSLLDPNGNSTTYSYTDVYSSCGGNAPPAGPTDAYVTSITYPQANGVNHSVGFCYDYPTGLLRSSTDENLQTTSYVYADSLNLNRLTETDYPDCQSGVCGQTLISYNDTAPNPTVTTSSKVNSSGTSVTVVDEMDGLGHTIQSQQTYGSGSTANTAIIYDGLGHKYTVTNPYFSTSDPTYGITTYTYDSLGRVTQVKRPDGSKANTAYSGRATQVTDEGNGTKSTQRISQSDFLGRLTSICEVSATTLPFGTSNAPVACGQDITGQGFLTTYTYDALGNLLKVLQGGLNKRTYAYDSLSRLVCAADPEAQPLLAGGQPPAAACPSPDTGSYTAGTIRYSYDANNNILTRIKPAPNQTNQSSTVTTTFHPDALNRVTSKSYSDGTTPTATFAYDKCPVAGCPSGYPTAPNVVGRLVESSNTNAQTFESYDPVGRVNNEWQCTPRNCGSGYFPLAYSFDLLGDMTSATNGVGTSFTYNYPAGQLTQVTSSLSDSNHPGTLLSNLAYNAFDAESSANLGNGLTESIGYTNRTQLQSLAAAGASSTPATATGSVAMFGVEQSYQVSATPSTDTLFFGGSCGSNCQGNASVTVGSQQATGSGATFMAIAQSLASSLGGTGLVTATAQNIGGGAQINMTSTGTGTGVNYSVSCSASSGFSFSQCRNMSGGTNGSTVYDTGTVSVTVNGFVASTTYGSTSTAAALASSLATVLNGSASPVTAALSGGALTLTSKVTGSAADYSLSVSSTSNNPSHFSPPSFQLSDSGGSLLGGAGGYDFALTFAPNGDVFVANDSVNGNWTYSYDDFGRLLTSVPVGKTWSYAYAFDRYGNRYQQNLVGTGGSGNTFSHTFDVNNHVNDATVTYDAAGNVMWDGVHNYTYDAENRLTRVDSGTTAAYVYDASGERVRKTSTAGALDFIYDQAGREIVEINSAGAWDRAEIYAAGSHLATYAGGASGTTYFDHADWLGTERARTAVAGTVSESCQSLPFGDGLSCTGSDSSPMHFTGQEHDSESNLDNFHARYDATSLGRFMSPDPVGGDSADPQTLNKYSYVRNNPLNFTDPTGEILQLVGNTQDDEDALKEMAGDFSGYVGTQTLNGVTTATFDCSATHDCSHLSLSAATIKYWVDSSGLFVFSARKLGKNNYEGSIDRVFTLGNHQFGISVGPDFAIDPWSCKGGACVPMYQSTLPIGPKLSEAEMEELYLAAEKAYPKLAGMAKQLHHVIPKYLGGAEDGELSKIPAAYHQAITSAIRTLAPYGQKVERAAGEVEDILKKVYSKLPLP